jgi:periplasmic protein TonB
VVRLCLGLLLALVCHLAILRLPLVERQPPTLPGPQTALNIRLAPAVRPVLSPPPPAQVVSTPAIEPVAAPVVEPRPEPPPPRPPRLLPKGLEKRRILKTERETPPSPPALATSPAPRERGAAEPVGPAPPASPPPAAVEIVAAVPAYHDNPKPVYPELARRRGWQGTVTLAVLVQADGAVAEVQLSHGSGYPLLDQSAEKSVRRWRFIPASHNGQPVAMTVLVPVHFTLE